MSIRSKLGSVGFLTSRLRGALSDSFIGAWLRDREREYLAQPGSMYFVNEGYDAVFRVHSCQCSKSGKTLDTFVNMQAVIVMVRLLSDIQQDILNEEVIGDELVETISTRLSVNAHQVNHFLASLRQMHSAVSEELGFEVAATAKAEGGKDIDSTFYDMMSQQSGWRFEDESAEGE